MVVAQASALLLWDVALLGLSFVVCTVRPAHGLTSIVRLRSDVGLFVELLVFGAIAAAVPCVVLLRTLFPHGAAGKSVGVEPYKDSGKHFKHLHHSRKSAACVPQSSAAEVVGLVLLRTPCPQGAAGKRIVRRTHASSTCASMPQTSVKAPSTGHTRHYPNTLLGFHIYMAVSGFVMHFDMLRHVAIGSTSVYEKFQAKSKHQANVAKQFRSSALSFLPSCTCAGCWDATLQEEEAACGIGSGSCAADRCGSGCSAGALGAGLCICALATNSALGVLGRPPGGSSAAHGLGVAAQEVAHHHCEKGQVLLMPVVPGNCYRPFCTTMFLQLFGWVLPCRTHAHHCH